MIKDQMMTEAMFRLLSTTSRIAWVLTLGGWAYLLGAVVLFVLVPQIPHADLSAFASFQNAFNDGVWPLFGALCFLSVTCIFGWRLLVWQEGLRRVRIVEEAAS